MSINIIDDPGIPDEMTEESGYYYRNLISRRLAKKLNEAEQKRDALTRKITEAQIEQDMKYRKLLDK